MGDQLTESAEFVRSTASVSFEVPAGGLRADFIGEKAFIWFAYSDSRPIVVTGIPQNLAGILALSSSNGATIHLTFTAKRLMDQGEPTEHWCASYLSCSVGKYD